MVLGQYTFTGFESRAAGWFALFMFSNLALEGLSEVNEADQCVDPIPSILHCHSFVPFYCKAPKAESGWCTSGECCCISHDEKFASPCAENDICCDGTCCNGDNSFCCGGQCCDAENEVCCNGSCTPEASSGLRIALPVILACVLFLFFCCIVPKGDEEHRGGRAIWGILLAIIFGMVQVAVGYSAWDCSSSVKAVVGVGFVYMIGGILIVSVAICVVRQKGGGLLDAFALERTTFIIGLVNQEGNLTNGAIATSEQVVQIRSLLQNSQAITQA